MKNKKAVVVKKDSLSNKQKVGIGVGLTAAAVAAAGAYFLYGSSDAAKNRKKIKGWALQAKGEILEALEKAEAMTEREYAALVEAISGAYTIAHGATKGEIADFKKEMKAHWKKIEKSAIAKKAKKVATSAAVGVAKKAAGMKKAVKKAKKKKK